MSDFPTLVYKGHGQHSRAGGTYDFSPANDADELSAKLSEGWFSTLPEAIDAHDKSLVKSAKNGKKTKVDNSPPTRAELETKAKELNIEFSDKTDDELGVLIAEALKG